MESEAICQMYKNKNIPLFITISLEIGNLNNKIKIRK